MKYITFSLAALLLFSLVISQAFSQIKPREYVGSKVCGECHVHEYANFTQYASKSRSDDNVKLMLGKLTPEEQRECFECHTTGYGRPGGFVSFETTPDLGHAGCEVCHGPGSEHVSTEDPGMIIRDLSIEEHCAPCHEDERVRAINYKPLLYSGAH